MHHYGLRVARHRFGNLSPTQEVFLYQMAPYPHSIVLMVTRRVSLLEKGSFYSGVSHDVSLSYPKRCRATRNP